VTPVNGVGRGARIRARRERMSWDKQAFAKRAGMNRETLARVEDDEPNVRATTYAQAERALDALAAELGFDDDIAEPHEPVEAAPIRLTFHDVYGIGEIIVEGPVDHPDELTEAVSKILEGIRRQQGRPTS
jgi:transcriptional regulator with XRE-family HTH domain